MSNDLLFYLLLGLVCTPLLAALAVDWWHSR